MKHPNTEADKNQMKPDNKRPERENEQEQAELLYDALYSGQMTQPGDPVSEEARLAQQIRAAAQETSADSRFKAGLEEHLLAEHPAKKQAAWSGVRRSLPALAWASLVVLAVVGLGWIIRNSLPVQPAPLPVAAGPASAPPVEVVELPPAETGTPTPLATPPPQPTLPALLETSYSSPSFPGVDIVLQAAFPEAPAEALVAEQLSDAPLTVDSAREAAGRLGVSGTVYELPSEAAQTKNYLVSDGQAQVLFMNSTNRFRYDSITIVSGITSDELPPAEEQAALAEAWLQEHGFLDYPHTSEVVADRPGVVRFYPLVNGYPLRYNIIEGPWLEATLGPGGTLRSLELASANYSELGNFPLRSAKDAWEKFTRLGTNNGVAEYSANPPLVVQGWQRVYPLGESVTINGYLYVYQPAEPGGTPRIDFQNYTVRDYPVDFNPGERVGEYLLVTGVVSQDELGHLVLDISSWQPIPVQETAHGGTIERQGNLAFLVNDENRLLMPDLPDNVPSGEPAEVYGLIKEGDQPVMDWNWLNVGAVMSGGGGGGSGMFVDLNLAGDSPVAGLSPTPTPLPAAVPGARLEGAEGHLFVMVHQYEDGTQRVDYELYLFPGKDFPDGFTVRLTGNVEGLQELHALPVRVWGVFTDKIDGLDALNLERYEEVYPGVRRQALTGIQEAASLENSNVLLLKGEDGTTYVQDSSIHSDPDQLIGNTGDKIVVVGILLPDKQFAGYPVISDDEARVIPPEKSDIYDPFNTGPFVFREQGSANTPRRMTIDHIELIYNAVDLRFGPPDVSSPKLYVQPVWRFTGSYADGTAVEILVQALPDNYLKTGQ